MVSLRAWMLSPPGPGVSNQVRSCVSVYAHASPQGGIPRQVRQWKASLKTYPFDGWIFLASPQHDVFVKTFALDREE
jgi:hypothetical protein